MTSLPKSWQIKPLVEVATLQRGFDLPVQNRTEGSVPIFAANGPVGTHNEAKVSGPGVVTGRSGTLGKVHYVQTDYWPLNTALWVKDFHGNDPNWVFRLLNWMKLETHTRGTGVPTLNRNLIHVVPVPLPPITEQRRIAAILDKADAVRRKRKEAIALTEELLRSAFLDMFGDPVTNPKGWEIGKVIDYCDCIVPGRDKPKSFTGSIPWVTTADLNFLGYTYDSRDGIGLSNFEIEQVRARRIPKDSVLLTCVGDLGVTSVAAQEMIVNQQLYAFQCNEIDNFFLMFALPFQKGFMFKRATQTTVPYMNKTTCNSIPTIYPPLKLQKEFGQFCRRILASQKSWERAHLKTEDLFNSLLQRAFRGDL